MMQITGKVQDGLTILEISGRVDHTVADPFRIELLGKVEDALALGHSIVLDLGHLDYISSAGLRALMMASRSAKSKSLKIVVAALKPVVQEIFTISRFSLVFPGFNTVPDATAKLKAG